MRFHKRGALATGTLRNGELETKLDEHGTVAATAHIVIPGIPLVGQTRHCEEAFSNDGRWLATVVPSSNLTVVILDRKTKTVHRSFSSEWQQIHKMPIELGYRSSFLGGFLPDDSVVLWRYIPRAVADTVDASNADLHMQRWSVEGELLSDGNLGAEGFSPGGRQPITFNGLNLLWIHSNFEVSSYSRYRRVRLSGGQAEEAGTLSLVTLPPNPSLCPEAKGFSQCLDNGLLKKQGCSIYLGV